MLINNKSWKMLPLATLLAASSATMAFDEFGGMEESDFDEDVRNSFGIGFGSEFRGEDTTRTTITPSLDFTLKPWKKSDFYIGGKVDIVSNTHNESRPKDSTSAVQIKVGYAWDIAGVSFKPAFTYKRNEGLTDDVENDSDSGFNEEYRFNPNFYYDINKQWDLSWKNKLAYRNRYTSRSNDKEMGNHGDEEYSTEVIVGHSISKSQKASVGVVHARKYRPDWAMQGKIYEELTELRLYYKHTHNRWTFAPFARLSLDSKAEYWEGHWTENETWRAGLSIKYDIGRRQEFRFTAYYNDADFGKTSGIVTNGTKTNLSARYVHTF